MPVPRGTQHVERGSKPGTSGPRPEQCDREVRQRVLTALYPGAGQTCAKLSERLGMPRPTLSQHLHALECDGCAAATDEVNGRGGREVHWVSTGKPLPEVVTSTAIVQRARATQEGPRYDAEGLLSCWPKQAAPRSPAEKGYYLGELMRMNGD